MHESTFDFVRRYVNRHKLAGARVLEVGSYNVNGGVRELFTGEYIGVDIEAGPGVDEVVSAHELDARFEPGSFELVVCLEMLEHDEAPWLTMVQLGRMVAPGGHLLVSARGNGFPLHNPPDRWRFMKDGFRTLLDLTGLKIRHMTGDPQVSGFFGICVKEA